MLFIILSIRNCLQLQQRDGIFFIKICEYGKGDIRLITMLFRHVLDLSADWDNDITIKAGGFIFPAKALDSFLA